jgi:hypothetical protein
LRFGNPRCPEEYCCYADANTRAQSRAWPFFEQAMHSIQDQQNQIRDQHDRHHPRYRER